MRLTNYCGLLIVAIIFAGCSQKTPEEFIAEAENAIYEKEPDKAIIVLKNALASDPKNLKSRFLLGRTYYEVGNIKSAEKELKIAYTGGYFKNEVLPIYLSTLNYLQQDQEIVELVDGLSGLTAESEAAGQMYKGLALFRQNEISRAKLAINRANEASPDSSYSMYGRANYAVFEKEPADALIILEELLASDPDFMEAVFLRGKLSVLSKDFNTAIDSFKQYVDKKPRDVQGNISLADALVKNQNYEEGEKLVLKLLSELKNNPFLNQLKGIIDFNKENYESAKLAMEAAINSGLAEPSARLVAGVSSYKLNKLEQAHNHLQAIKDLLPSSHPALRLLAEIQLSLGYTTGAAETIQGLTNLSLNDVRLFTQTSYELIEAREYEKASQFLNVAKQLNSNQSDELLRIALLKLELKDESAIKDLKDILKSFPENTAAIIALSQAYSQSGRYDEAIGVAKGWAEKEPAEIASLNLLGQIYEGAGKLDLAESIFIKALEISKYNPASLEFLAKQATKAGNEQQSLEMRKKIAENHPLYLQGLFEYFAYSHEQGDSTYAFNLIEKSYLSNKNDTQVVLNFARALVIKKDATKVIEVLNTIEYQKDLPVFFWKAKADSYLELDEISNALSIYKSWQGIEPNNLYAWLGELIIYDITDEFSKALNTVNNAKAFFPNEPQLKLFEIHYNLINKNLLIAKRLYEGLDEELKRLPFGKGLKGQFYYADGEFDKAIPLLEEYYADTMNGRVALTIANAKRNNGDVPGSLETLEAHLKIQSDDFVNRLHLAERYLDLDPVKSIFHYRELLKQQTDNLLVLNNLAFLLGEQGELAEAQELIKGALDLNSDNATLNNTYGNILLKDNQVSEAQVYLKKAFDNYPSNQTYREDYERAFKLAN